MNAVKSSLFNRRTLRAAAASAVLLAGGGFGLNAYAVDAGASATVVQPISIVKDLDLRFGSFTSPSAIGTAVVIGADGSRTLGTGVLGVGTTQNAFGAASFTVNGEKNLAYTVSFTNASVDLLRQATGATEKMTVASFTTNLTNSVGQLSASGTQTLKVGATLSSTAATQVSGIYSGTFAVTVAYN